MSATAEHHGHEHGHGEPHVMPLKTYFAVFGTLLFLTVLTYAVSFADLGAFALPVALIVATVKATLVVLFFMHLLWDTKFNILIFVSTIFFMLLFFGFTMLDVSSRGLIDPIEDPAYFRAEQAKKAAAEAATP